jgi:hypothetical protein
MAWHRLSIVAKRRFHAQRIGLISAWFSMGIGGTGTIQQKWRRERYTQSSNIIIDTPEIKSHSKAYGNNGHEAKNGKR